MRIPQDGDVHPEPSQPWTDLRRRLIGRFRWVDPGPASTHLVSDVSGWWRDTDILARIGPALADPFQRPAHGRVGPDGDRPTVVVSPEVTGLLLGPLVAVALGVGFLPAYKDTADRAIAEPATWAETGPDYRGRTLALGVRDRHLGPGDRVLVVDDWITTGAQARALWQVIVARGAEPVGTAAVVADCPPATARELRLHALLTARDLSP